MQLLAAPSVAAASPARLSVTATVSAKPLLGGKATIHVVVKNIDTTDKAYNISVEDTVTSNDTTAYATFVSASDANGAVPPSVNGLVPTPPASLVLKFINIRDLAPQESYAMDIQVDLGPSSAWKVGDLLQNAVRASGNTIPNQTIPDITATTAASQPVVPIIIKSKTADQSTGVEQATGTSTRQYSYTVNVQNNYVGSTQNVVVVDKLPDGVEFLGMAPASTWATAPATSRDASTGVTTLTWNLGTMAAGATQAISYKAGIRYDYYGTNDGGKNRSDAATLTTATAGAPIPDKTTLTNNVRLDATWQSNPASDTAASSVSAAYLTISKAQTPNSGGSIDTTIDYTLSYYNSQYYSILATSNSILVHDHLPDGQQFETGTANPAPTSTLHNADGSTDITWTVGPMSPTSDGTITFEASVRQTWKEPSYAGDPVVSGDTMTNTCDIRGVYVDQVNPARTAQSTSAASSGYSTSLPNIYKAMKSPDDPSGPWLQNIDMSVGDTTTVRVQFNTKDGATPERTNIDMGNIMLNDWLPAGMAIVPGTFHVTYSNAGDFSLPTTNTLQPALNISDPTTLTVSGLNGAQWYLGDVAPSGWWQATFDVVVQDVPAAADGVIVANLWKLTGYNTFGTPYSDRAAAMTINYREPHLTLTKSVTRPSPLSGGSTVPYTVTVNNTGTGTAHQVSITDTLPADMRGTPPDVQSVKLDGSALTSGTDYVTSWDPPSGTLGVVLQQGAVRTDVPGGSSVVVAYNATVDDGAGAGESLTNTATVSYSTRPTPDGHVTPGTNNVADDNTDAATITCDDLVVHKAVSLTPGPDTLGGLFTYDVTFTVPPRTRAYSPIITDTIQREGVAYGGTATLTRVSGPVSATASFASTSTPVKSTPAAGQTALTWTLANPVDNSGGATPAVFDLQFTVQDTGVANNGSWEFAPPTGTDSFNDMAVIAYRPTPSGTPRSASSNTVATSVGQPVLSVTKAFNPVPSPLPIGGSTINYRVTVTNTGSQPAYDVSLDDTLPLEASSSVLTSASLSGVGDVTAQITTSFTSGPPPAIHFLVAPSIGAGKVLTIDYKITLGPAVAANTTLKNTVDADWNSIAGAPPGSRVYNDSPQEAYTGDTANQTINAQNVTILKTAPAGPLTLGDVATYTIDVTVPADTLVYWPQIADLVYMRGTQYEPGTASITTLSGSPSVPATIAPGMPTSSIVGTNRQYVFNLNDQTPGHEIDNTNQGAPYQFRLTFGVRITGNQSAAVWDFAPPTTHMNLRDDGSIAWAVANAATRAAATLGAPVASNNKNTLLVQPLLKSVKSVPSGTGPYAGGDYINYEVLVSNVGSSTAYDLSAVDTLPVETSSAVLTGAALTGTGSIASSVTASYLTTGQPHLQFAFDPSVTLGTTQTITLDYRIQLQNTVGAGATLTNTFDANWWSLPSSTSGARQYNDASQEGANWTQDTSSASVNVAQVAFGKRITSGLTTATIGTIVPYTLEATVPINTTAYGLTMTDTVPPGLTVLSATGTVGLPAPTIVSTSAAGTLIVWNTGVAGVPNPPYTTATLNLLCQVRDTSYAGGPVPSGPIANGAQLSWRTQSGGGSIISTTAPTVTFNVVQPNLTVTKTTSAGTAGAGDTVTFTSVISNTGTSTAYTTAWNDVLPAQMTNPTLVSVTHSSAGVLSSPADFSTSVSGNQLNVAFDQLASPANAIAPSDSVTIKFTGTVIGGVHNGTAMPDTATVSSYVSLPATSVARTYGPVSVSRVVTATSPALVVTKSVIGSAYPLQGDTVHYRFTVKNVGTAPAHAVATTDTLPADVTYVTGSTSATWPSASSTWTTDPSGGSGPTLAWDFGGGATLAPGDTLTLNFDAAVAPAAPIGSRTNTQTAAAVDAAGSPVPPNCSAWISADTSPTDTATAVIRVTKPGMAVTKVTATGQDPFVQAGQPVGFKITVNNTGDTTLTTLPLADTYDPSRFTYSSASVAPNTVVAGTLAWTNFGPIAPYASRSVTVTFTAGSNLPSNTATNSAVSAGTVDEFGHPLPSSSDTASVQITKPQVSVSKMLHAGQDTTVQAGQTVTYDITVTNTGDTQLTTVPLADTFAAANLAFSAASASPDATGSGSVSWNNLGALAPGDSESVTATFMAIAAPVGNTTTDTARVAGATDVNGDHPATVQSSASVAITRPAVTVTKTLAPGQDPVIMLGQTVTYLLTVKNTGDTALSSVNLNDTWDSAALGLPSSLPPGAFGTGGGNWALGPLAVNASTVVTLTLSSLSVPTGQITTDTAAASGADVYGDPATSSNSQAAVRITSPGVSVTKTLHAGQDPIVQVGQKVGFDVTIKNTGDTALNLVPLIDDFTSSCLAYTTATVPPTSLASNVATWTNTGALAVGASRTITVTFTVTAVPSGNTGQNEAWVIGGVDQYGHVVQTAHDAHDITVTDPALTVTKTAHAGQDPAIQAGQTATFDLTVTNSGDTTLSTVALSDTWDSAVFDYSSASVAPSTLASGSAAWTLSTPIAPGGHTTLTLSLVALSSPISLVGTDVATATGTDVNGDPTTPSSSSASVLVTRPDVVITKTLHAGQDPVVQAGQSVVFDITAHNSGDTTLTAVPLSDAYDGGALQFQSASLAPDSSGGGALTWANSGQLLPGTSRTITATFTALAVPSNQVTTDTATCAGATDNNGDVTASSSADASVRITAPGVSITKQLVSGDPAIQPGQSATFLITVTNTGDTLLSTVPLADTYDAAILAPTGSTTPTDSAGPGTLAWNQVGPLLPGQSHLEFVTFRAVAVGASQVTTNTATTSGVVDQYGDPAGPATSGATVKVTHPALTLAKTLHTGQDPAIQTSQTVTFDLTVTNTGDTTLTAVPLSDSWDPTYLLFSASAPPATSGTGNATWLLGPVPPGGSATVELTLLALAPVPGLTTNDTAAVKGATDENGDPTNDATSSAGIDVTRPAVGVTKALHPGQDSDVQVGEDVGYDITVTNSGDTTLSTVPLADTYDPALLSFSAATTAPDSTAPAGTLTWNDTGGLNPGASRTITVTFTAEATAAAVTNTATVAGATDVNGDPAPPSTGSDSTLRVTAPSLTLTKTLHPGQDPQIQPGQEATYDLTLTNSGDTTLTLSEAVDEWDPGVFEYTTSTIEPVAENAGVALWVLPVDIAPGGSYTFSVTLAALASPTGLHSPDLAGAIAQDEFGDETQVTFDEADILVTQPGVSVNKALHAGQDPVVQAGETVSYDIGVTNSGNTTLTAVPLADMYDADALKPVSASPAAVDYANDGTLNWANVGPLAPGETTTVTVDFTALSVPNGQLTTDTATVAGARDLYDDPAPDASSSASVRVTAPAVSVVKTPVAGQDPAVQAGQPVGFDIRVTNTGDTTLTTVPLSDAYDATYLSSSGATPGVDSSTPGTLSWDNVGPLAPGETTTVTVGFTAITNPPGQVTTDTATVADAIDQYGDQPADVSSSASVKITHPALTLSKKTADGQDPYIQVGQTVTYDLTVTNSGDTTLTSVPLSDVWDAGYLTFSSASMVPQTLVAGSASWTLGPIAPGQSTTVKLTLLATKVVPDFRTTDTATVVDAVDENGDAANDAESSASIDITIPAIRVAKVQHAGQDRFIQVGQDATYDIGVTNSGDTTLAVVPLSDNFDASVFDLATTTPSPSNHSAGHVVWDSIGPIGPGDTATTTVTLTAIATSGGSASVDTATVSGALDVNGDPAGGNTSTSSVTVTRPEVTVHKLLAPGQPSTVKLGDDVTYDLVVTNSGDTALSTVPLGDSYTPWQLEFLSAIPAPSVLTTSTGRLEWGNIALPSPLAPGDSATVTATFKTLVARNELADIADSKGATDANGDTAPNSGDLNSALAVYDPASLGVTKTADPPGGTIMLPGSTITYTISWENTGSVTIPGVVVSDPLPASVSYVAGSLTLNSASQTDPADADQGSYDPATRTVALDIGPVPAETHGSASFKVAVGPESVSASGVMNSAYFRSAESTIATAGPVYHPVDPITIFKTGKNVSGGQLKGGSTIAWTITVKNIGLTPTTHVVVTDTVPNTTIYVKGSIQGRGANDGGVPHLVWDVGTMAVGETQILTFRSTVKKGLPSGTLIKNQATVVSDQSRPKKSDNPQTPTHGDPTILVARTSGSEGWRLPLAALLLLMVGGLWFWPGRRELAVVTPPPGSDDPNGGGRNE